eukprot:Gb_29210 [translate_table: standard]
MASSFSYLTVAAKGNRHSINGQAQALNGLVLDMSSMKGIDIFLGSTMEFLYVDVYARELWVDLLTVALHVGLALSPRLIIFLFLWVGHCPMGELVAKPLVFDHIEHATGITLVVVLKAIEINFHGGMGEALTCSPEQNRELFYGAIGAWRLRPIWMTCMEAPPFLLQLALFRA